MLHQGLAFPFPPIIFCVQTLSMYSLVHKMGVFGKRAGVMTKGMRTCFLVLWVLFEVYSVEAFKYPGLVIIVLCNETVSSSATTSLY